MFWNQKSIVLPIALSLLVIGCTQTTEEATTDSTSTETIETVPDRSSQKDAASLLVGNWKAIVDTDAETNGLSEEEQQYFDEMMKDFEFIMKFTEDGQVMTSMDDEIAEYKVEGDEIILDGERSQLTVTETELTIETDGETMSFSRTDKDVSEVADLESQMETATEKIEAEIESDIGSASFKEAEAQTYTGAMNRAGQAYYLENAAFANTIEDLALGLQEETDDYQYSIRTTEMASFNYAISKNEEFKSFVGGVFAMEDGVTETVVCVADTPGMSQLGEPTLQENELLCPEGTTQVE
ncbi:type IV pilin-like G/H family protein [Oscillatoriales cyanobacterium LEGE 11467]|uniref:Type IV pilin-like G/H family protein n=1 Tax=Zarconia navalis LEGE 11467 TaxID=1828826 RepID=A0A928VXD4_9CYAN|nr:type IV pilin-like G/H family protein [Zarconia navalis]MBE9041028.1 type IV pilin-like G/H family protein [Zarconia navalis LEGE 11467]